jgi:WD40 repeat protein
MSARAVGARVAAIVAVLTVASSALISQVDANWPWWAAAALGVVVLLTAGLTGWLWLQTAGSSPRNGDLPQAKAGVDPVTRKDGDTVDWVSGEIIDPRPLDSKMDLAHFTGRKWLIDRIDAYIRDNPRGYVVVEAEAGVGKSALAAHLARTRSYVCHFTSLQDGRSPERARRNLTAQLIVAWQLQDLAPEAGAEGLELLRVLEAAANRRNATSQEPLVLIVDGLDEADRAPGHGRDTDTDIPLGLPRPRDLPPGVFIVATCRVGTPLPALHGPLVARYPIHVKGADNIADMDRFVTNTVTGVSPQRELVCILQKHGVDSDLFVKSLLDRCGGVWIYLRYVLDDILTERRSPADVQTLPKDLIGYYREQISSWSGDAKRWQSLRLPVVATLVALRRPVTRAEIARFANVPDGELLRRWLDEQELRPFLAVTPDSQDRRQYAIRHDSLRDLFASFDEFDEHDGTPQALYEGLLDAHQRITAVLIPSGCPGERNWRAVDTYTRGSLAEHAAYSSQLNELACDPGFLLVCDAASLLRHRGSVTTYNARAAIAAYELVLDEWTRCDNDELRLWWLHVWARKTRSRSLADHAVAQHPAHWQVISAMWTGSSHRTLTGHTEPVRTVCALPLLKRPLLASAGLDKGVRLWDPDAGALLSQLSGYKKRVNALCAVSLSDGYNVLVSGGADGTVRLWDPVSGEPARHHPLTGHTDEVSAVCALTLPDDRNVLVSASLDGTVRLWDPDSGEQVGQLSGDAELVNALCAVSLSDGCNILVSAGADGTVRFWDPGTRKQVDHPLTGHTDKASSVCALTLPDGRNVLVSASPHGTVRFWDLDRGEQAGLPLTDHIDEVSAVCEVPILDRPSLLASAGRDRALRLWDPDRGEQVSPPLTGHTDEVSAVCALTLLDGRSVVASAGHDRVLRLWDPNSDQQASQSLTGHTGEVSALCALTLDGRGLLVSGGHDRLLRLWDPISGEQVGQPLTGHTDDVSAVCALTLPDGRSRLASGSVDGTVWLWDPDSGQQAGAPLAGHTGAVSAVSAVTLPDGGSLLASASLDGTVRLWDPDSGEQFGTPLAGHTGWVTVVCEVVVEGRSLLATAGDDRQLRLWNPVSGQQVDAPLVGHTGTVKAMCALTLPDGRRLLASAGEDPMLRLWNPVSGQQVGRLLVRHGSVNVVCPVVLPNRSTALASGGVDGTVQLWDPDSGEQLGQPLAGHTGQVTAVCPLPQPDGHTLMATAGADCTVLVWGPAFQIDKLPLSTSATRPRHLWSADQVPTGMGADTTDRVRIGPNRP